MAEKTAYGTCIYNNPFAGGDMCMEFVGAKWNEGTAKARCDQAMPGTAGTLKATGRCDVSGAGFAGWCSTEEATIMTATFLNGQTCDEAAGACKTWSRGTFVADGDCKNGGSDTSSPGTNHSWDANSTQAGEKCMLAPGAIGAAHQFALSPGYSTDCKGTPAQQSPYMWPLRWAADVESKSFKFGSDEVQYHTKGHVKYMLDKNWKRLDTHFQRGVQRGVGQGPCGNTDTNSSFGCRKDSNKTSTMLHRGPKMVFIHYFDNGTISDCGWMDLAIIGNIRPDWFMDDRGDSTDVQYLGDSHVYYKGEPRLVKQWRKKDFANQYFTMSMQRLAGKDGVNWPLILNVPGEGFGDDFLQDYTNHRLVEESETDDFLLDEAHVKAGGSCPKIGGGGANSGPPTGQTEHIPSNLEVDKAAWSSIVYTGSPVWKAPEPKSDGQSAGSVQVTKEVTAMACFDEKTSALRLSIKAEMPSAAWAAVTFRDTEECLMTPRGGGNADMVYASLGSDGYYSMHFGPLTPSTKRFQDLDNFEGTLKPINEIKDFQGASAEFINGALMFSFSKTYSSKPSTPLYMNFAFGNNGKIGYHKSRACFELAELPTCPAFSCAA
eukprot:TRINITY_DN1720_c0_g2_i2.p1 TRINITY_DN1720_c0_g2~~TRINITY_DN1720_c0_g2_i2.p1  ORF type:complete len:686 (+),score=117.07 TRINITY_DN1720_c0_g2_i2:248-2059(+)